MANCDKPAEAELRKYKNLQGGRWGGCDALWVIEELERRLADSHRETQDALARERNLIAAISGSTGDFEEEEC